METLFTKSKNDQINEFIEWLKIQDARKESFEEGVKAGLELVLKDIRKTQGKREYEQNYILEQPADIYKMDLSSIDEIINKSKEEFFTEE